MKIFINDIPVLITEKKKKIEGVNFHRILGSETNVAPSNFKGNVLVVNHNGKGVADILQSLKKANWVHIISITFLVANEKKACDAVKSNFNIIEAAGGLVVHEGKYLLIYRLGKWDLPKGKLEKGESDSVGAVREVEEECSIKVKIEHKICTTWHTYIHSGKNILKKTVWYAMTLIDGAGMKPQKEEDIEELRWCTPAEAAALLAGSYGSIRRVQTKYEKIIRQNAASAGA